MFGPVVIPVELKFYRSDPLAVAMIFENPDGTEVEWQVSRELMRDGLKAEVGQGDVSFWPCGMDSFAVFLDQDGCSASMQIDAMEIRKFLHATEKLVPYGGEEALVFDGFDDWWEDNKW